MARRTRANWGSLDFMPNAPWFGLCAFIAMLALPLKSFAVDPTQLGLDSLVNFAAYAGGSNTVTGTTTINGDVGLGPNGVQNFGTGFTINGTYKVDDNPANNGHAYSGTISGGTVTQDINYVGAKVSSVSAYAASLASTTNFASVLSSSVTIIGNGGYNIISLPGISYTGSRTLTLQGGANDIFIINVGNNNLSFAGANATPITLSGGVATNHVLFNLLSTSAGVNALNVSQPNETLFGTFIAPYASISIGADKIYGGLFAGGNNLTLSSGGTITADVFALPEPSSFVLVGISCLFGLGAWSRRRRA